MESQRVLTQVEIEKMLGSVRFVWGKAAFDASDVPNELVPLIPYASYWGFADDGVRESVLRSTPTSLLRNIKWAATAFDDELNAWLAGPQSYSSNPSDAYIAFSAMRMGADGLPADLLE